MLRSLGGCVGIAVGSTIVSNSVLGSLNNLDSSTSLTQLTIDYVKGHIYNKVNVDTLSAAETKEIRDIYTKALRNYFYLLIPLMAICVITTFFVKDHGLCALDERPAPKRKEDLESSASSMTLRN